ncbi:hypothetical protein E0493_11180 [Roseomonas sp. M0104]|uniref:Uncharacterized protein n=1 Tax=Teichococcus coralli TaxID=2545983 RepID=A0A845BEZ8_9PROT|nr:hypothetical protein [Pseudoroseomonas coralli]MXP63907.1 hypothetical protein [Pseudoroseomonas coralli]
MRVQPEGYTNSLRIHWLCAALHHLLGKHDLEGVPALMAGFGSVLDHPAMGNFATAAHSLRLYGLSVGSDLNLRQAVLDALAWEEEREDDDDYREPPFRIDAGHRHFAFHLREGTEARVAEMVRQLLAQPPHQPQTLQLADTTRPMRVASDGSENAEHISIDLSSVPNLPLPPRHDVSRPAVGPITVSFEELVATAAQMDARDQAVPGRPPGNWVSRLQEATGEQKFDILAPERAAGLLRPTRTIELAGLKHLIGLPGTGKSTLIIILLVLLNSRGLRVVVLLPSIEASINLLGDLQHYGCDVGLLVGQSPQTRLNHAHKLAERLGADEARGLGRSMPGAELLGLNCALGGFDEDPEGTESFPHLMPPCITVEQHKVDSRGRPGKRPMPHLCPLGSVCGRLKAPRELTVHRIWLGHVLSMDTNIGAHFSTEKMRYFEAIAMASDLVIVDEADGAQKALDNKAISALDLTGSEASLDHLLHRDLFVPMAAGQNSSTATNVQSYRAIAADFGKLNHALVVHLQRAFRRNGTEGVLARFKETFVTSNTVVNELFGHPEVFRMEPEDRLFEDRRIAAVRAFWDSCVQTALFRRTERGGDIEFNPERIAADLGVDQDRLERTGTDLQEVLRDWLSEPSPVLRDALLDRARDITFGLAVPIRDFGPEERSEMFRFLAEVTALIFQFLRLVPAQQAMVSEGVHRETLFRDGISEDLGRLVPEALIGRLSGIRYFNEERNGKRAIRVQYVTFRGTPRALLYRLHELLRHEGHDRGPAVLLASATSFLEESPSYHVPVGPDIVLRRPGSDTGWRGSRYQFDPIQDPEAPGQRLRFSGAPLNKRAKILRAMVDHYFDMDDPLVLRMNRDFDPGRRVAFVVNSYEQVRQFKEHLRRSYPALAEKVIGVIDVPPPGQAGDWVTTAQVERLGSRGDWVAMVFPMRSLARGVNIVFEDGPRRRDAILGTMVFLTRPHPATESLDLATGIVGAGTLKFERQQFPPHWSTDDLAMSWGMARRDLTSQVRRLLRFPLISSKLGALAEPFTADIMVDVLQAIGRAMRNGCKARVIFADAAWAPRSAAGQADNSESSMLVMMRDILRQRVHTPDPVESEIYRALYQPFLAPLESCHGVRFSDEMADVDE